MLVLTRKPQEVIQIGPNIRITIVRVSGQSVRVGIEAPDEVRVVRGELMFQSKNGATMTRELSESAELGSQPVPKRLPAPTRPRPLQRHVDSSTFVGTPCRSAAKPSQKPSRLNAEDFLSGQARLAQV